MSKNEAMDKRIAEMTLEQKLGMLICARAYIFHEEEIDDIIELVKKRALGAIQVRTSKMEILEKIKEVADYPILVVNDMERGYPGTKLPHIPLCCLAACGNEDYYRAFAKGVVRDAQNDGFNGNWGPVIDILGGDGPIKIPRNLSDDPERVAEISEKIAGVFHQNHFFTTGKHFPGGKGRKGSESVDSHLIEAASDATVEELMEFSLVPYKHLMEKGLLDCIMSTHTVYEKIDPEYPATVSKKVISIIRDMGFDGVIFTDSLSMSGIRQRYEEEFLIGNAVAAGHDILLPCFNSLTKDVLELLKKNYEKGVITDERLNEAVRHVLTLQDFVGSTPENPTVFTDEDEALLNNVARDCVTAITDDGVPQALTSDVKDKLFVVIEEEKKMDEVKGEISISAWYESKEVGAKILEEYPEANIVYMPPLSTTGNHVSVLDKASRSREIVLVTQCYTDAYLGTDCLTRRSEAILNALINTGKVSAVVHFGNPFALKNLLHVPRKIFGYIMRESQPYTIEVLSGKTEAKGVLPFDVPFK